MSFVEDLIERMALWRRSYNREKIFCREFFAIEDFFLSLQKLISANGNF